VKESVHKRHPPSKVKPYCGFNIHSEEQYVAAETRKLTKYSRALDEAEAEHKQNHKLDRLQWASIVGKYQHVAPVVQGGQQLLTNAYRARDALADGSRSGLSWAQGTMVEIGDQAWSDIRELEALLPAARRRYYLDGKPEENGFWEGKTTVSNEEMDRTSTAHAGIPVYTGDAAGDAGGFHYRSRRNIHRYGPSDCAPQKSSNYRELDTSARGVKEYAGDEQWSGQRVLVRTDNTTSMSIINREGTMSPALETVSRDLQ
jgi:hypothetical protein